MTTPDIEKAKEGLSTYVTKTVDPYLDSIIVDIDKGTLDKGLAATISTKLYEFQNTVNNKIISFSILLSVARISDPKVTTITKHLIGPIERIYSYIKLGKMPQAKTEVEGLRKIFDKIIDPYLAIK